MRVRLFTVAFVCLWCCSQGGAGSGPEVKKALLAHNVSRFPTIDTNDIACPSFDADIWNQVGETGCRIFVRYRRPGGIEAMLIDDDGGTPCALYRDQTVMVFEPAHPRLIVAQNLKLNLSILPGEEGRAHSSARLFFGKAKFQQVQIDLSGIMEFNDGVLRDNMSTDTQICIERLRVNGKRQVAKLDLEQNPPICTLECFEKASERPSMVLKLTVHADQTDRLFQTPDLARVAEVMPVYDSLADGGFSSDLTGVVSGMKAATAMYQAIWTHIAVHLTTGRADFKFPGFTEPDWDVVARNKRQLGPKLRDLCGLPSLIDHDNEPLTPQLSTEDTETLR